MISIITAIVVVILDGITKYLVTANMTLGEEFAVIEGILNIKYIHNDAGIFGMKFASTASLLLMSAVIIFLLCFVAIKYRGQSRLFDVCIGLMLGGGVGNFIDRIAIGKVIDFIDFCAFDFWRYIFNVADCGVVIGCILAIVYVFFDSKKTNEANKEVIVTERENTDSDTSENDHE